MPWHKDSCSFEGSVSELACIYHDLTGGNHYFSGTNFGHDQEGLLVSTDFLSRGGADYILQTRFSLPNSRGTITIMSADECFVRDEVQRAWAVVNTRTRVARQSAMAAEARQ